MVRSDALTMRFDPKLKYFASLAARSERRTVSSFIEQAVEERLNKLTFYECNKQTTMAELERELWAPCEADRFVKLADRLPFLLTYEEEMLWELIQNDQKFWLTASSDGVSQLTFNFKVHREHWDRLKSEASEKAAKEPAIQIGGFPFRGGRIDSSIPSNIAEPETSDAEAVPPGQQPPR
jgi:hypothetical protein